VYNSLINRQFLDQISGFFGIINLNAQFEIVNKTGAEWTGFDSADEMKGLTYRDVRCKAAEDYELFLQHDELVKEKGRIRFIGYYCYSNNSWKIILGEKYLIKNEVNEPIGIVSHFNDFSRSNIVDVSRFLIHSRKKYDNKTNNQFIYLIDDFNQINYKFSPRQMECLFFLIRGKTTKQIAQILNLSPRTIEEHIIQIKLKMNCNSISQVIEQSISEGYINLLPESIFEKLNQMDN